MIDTYYKNPPQISTNNLKDMVECLKKGDVVVLTIGNEIKTIHYNHLKSIKYDASEKSIQEIVEFLSTKRVIFIDVAKNPGLTDDGEWNYYFEQIENVKMCQNNLSNFFVNHLKKVPYLYKYLL